MAAKDYMIPKEMIAQLSPDDSVDTARAEMKKRSLDFVLIKPPRDSAVWKIFTEADLIRAKAMGKKRAVDCASFLTKGASEDASENECLQIMGQWNIQHLGIVDANGNLVGVLLGSSIY